MDKLAFDPDAYLNEGTQSGFDPDAYLGIEKKKPSMMETMTAPLTTPLQMIKENIMKTGTDPVGTFKKEGVALPILGGAIGGFPGGAAGEFARQAIGTAVAPETVPQTSLGRFGSMIGQGLAAEPSVLRAIPGVPAAEEAAGNVLSNAGQGMKEGWSKLVQAATGKPAAKVRQLIADPGAILPQSLGGAKSVEEASANYGKALENAPVHNADGSVTIGLNKRLFGPFSEGKAEADKVGNEIYTKWKTNRPITAQEAFDAKRATDKVWPAVVKERNAEDIRELSNFKTAMDGVLSNQSGHFQKASADYARAKLGADFTQILPRTKTGDISTVKAILSPLIMDTHRLPLLAASSPMVMGGLTAGTVGAGKGLNTLGQIPQIRQALMGILQQIMTNRANQQQQPQPQ